jgi:hypothetical protein
LTAKDAKDAKETQWRTGLGEKLIDVEGDVEPLVPFISKKSSRHILSSIHPRSGSSFTAKDARDAKEGDRHV